MFGSVYGGKKVFITGHTGFKGSWLSEWLCELETEVCGYSINVPSTPSNFEILKLRDRITHIEGDICDREQLYLAMRSFEPDIVFHLAAQSLVRRSFDDPVITFETNAMGTMNVLECIRRCPSVKSAVIITSDKCYRNLEWTWGYRENDVLGGEDPYSASKGCAELIIYSYIRSFFKEGPFVASARAGNVIGGGDWAEDRIVPDAVRSWSRGDALMTRNPHATRPWQHVLEPLSGYLWLGSRLLQGDERAIGQAFNFGPGPAVNQSVEELLSSMKTYWKKARFTVERDRRDDRREATLLKLCCDKSYAFLEWNAILSFEETVAMTMEWYRTYYENEKNEMQGATSSQIKEYSKMARERGLSWAMS